MRVVRDKHLHLIYCYTIDLLKNVIGSVKTMNTDSTKKFFGKPIVNITQF